jgi:hypothetical protein
MSVSTIARSVTGNPAIRASRFGNEAYLSPVSSYSKDRSDLDVNPGAAVVPDRWRPTIILSKFTTFTTFTTFTRSPRLTSRTTVS